MELLGISLPLVILLEQGLGVVVHALGLSVGGSRGNVAGLVQEPVDIVVEIVKEQLELVVLLDIFRGLNDQRMLKVLTLAYLLGCLDDIVKGLVGDLFDKGLQVSTGLLNLFILVADVGLFGSLLDGVLGLVGVLFEETDDGGDRSLVFWLLLGRFDDLENQRWPRESECTYSLESLDKLLSGLLSIRQLVVDVLSELLDLVPDVLPGLTLEFTGC